MRASRRWFAAIALYFTLQINSAIAQTNPAPAALPATPSGADVSAETLDRLRQNVRLRADDAQAREALVRALNSTALFQMNQGNLLAARVNLVEATGLGKPDIGLLNNLAFVYLRLGDYTNAEDVLRSSLAIDGNNLDTHYLLGLAYYNAERLTEAIDEWTAALRLGNHPQVARSLDKARAELAVRDELGELRSGHFVLRYDRKFSNQELGPQILLELDNLYTKLTADLLRTPPATITVILYPDQFYFDITRAPSWSGAVFDGKIRIPIKGLSAVTPSLIAVLTHELTHAFVSTLPQGVPVWFNEGLAQMEEGKSAASVRATMTELRQTQALIPLKTLARSFAGMSSREAGIAYAQSLSAVDYIATRYGKTSLRFVLELMSQYYTFDAALQTALRQSLAEFELAWQRDSSQ